MTYPKKKTYRGCRKLKKRRIIPAIIVLCVIFAIVPQTGAAAAGMSGLEVIGQTTMTQETFTDLSIIGANSSGLIDAINGAKNPAQSIGEWIKGEWDNWLLRQQLTWGTVLNIAAAGARYTGNGDLLFNSQLSDLFTRYYNWLWDGEGGPNIKDYAESVPVEGDNHLNLPDNYDRSNLSNPGYTFNINVSNSIDFIADNGNHISGSITNGYVTYVGRNHFLIFSNVPGQRLYYSYGSGSSSIQMNNGFQDNGNVFYYYQDTQFWPNFSKPYSFAISSVLNTSGNAVMNDSVYRDIIRLVYGYEEYIGDDQILGDPDKLGGLTGADTNVVAPPDVINWPDFGGNGGYIDVNDYISGLRGAIESQDGTADVNITDSQGIESTQTMEIDQATDIPVEQETTSELVNQGEVISTATPSTELSEYTIDLRNYFPFCIPWDLYDMVTILVAEPVAPRVQYPFVIEPLNVNYTIDLDFSKFDSVAAVLRTMELLAAGIGLALMTKRLIQGGD